MHWGFWDGALKPVLRIALGDRVIIETLSGEPEDMPDPALGFSVVPGQKEVFATTFRVDESRIALDARDFPCFSRCKGRFQALQIPQVFSRRNRG